MGRAGYEEMRSHTSAGASRRDWCMPRRVSYALGTQACQSLGVVDLPSVLFALHIGRPRSTVGVLYGHVCCGGVVDRQLCLPGRALTS